MRLRAARVRLGAVLLGGLAIGAIGLLEPLVRFWPRMQLAGLSWPGLLGLYLGSGLVIAIVAGIGVTLGSASRSAQWHPISAVAYYVAGTVCLAGVLVVTPLLERELAAFQLSVPPIVIVVLLLLLGVLFTTKATPRVITPIFAALIGKPGGRISPARVTVLLVVIGLLVAVTAISGEHSRYRPLGRPARAALRSRPSGDPIQNVLLITVDALRADRLGAYGARRNTSPAIDALAGRAVLFENCFSQGNSTELSFGSIFTSLYPSMHSVRRYKYLASPLAEEVETLAEHMRDAGLHTIGLADNPFIKREWGLAQGFDELDEFHYGYLRLLPVRTLTALRLLHPPERIPGLEVPRAATVVDEAIRRLHRMHNRPFLLFMHFMDVHHPYIPPVRHQELFRSPGSSPIDPQALWNRGWAIFRDLPSQPELLSPGDLNRIVDLYDASVHYVDEQIGRLLATLDQLGLTRKTLIIVTADHGEEFLEHGDIFHKNQSLYDELTHVPLIIYDPSAPNGRRVKQIVRHIDLMPTLLELFELPPDPAAQGQSLQPLLTGTGSWLSVPAFSQSYEALAVRTPTRKLIHDLVRGRSLCFNLIDDPNERRDISGTDAACDSLDDVLVEFLKKASVLPGGTKPEEIDPRAREILRSLGYM